MSVVKIEVKSKLGNALRKRISEFNNDTTMLAVHNTLAKMCDPYVPMQNGPLSQTSQVSPQGVRYVQPYARYQYYGEVYGPNIPIKEDGDIIGWFSPKGQRKHPTGRPLTYSTEYHPLATSFWDKAMMRDHGDEFIKEVRDILDWRMMNYDAKARK